MSEEEVILARIKKSMDRYRLKTKWWQIRKVYKSFRKMSWSRFDSISQLFAWWWRLTPFSTIGRMSRQMIWLEAEIANRELAEIKELFGLNVGLYSLSKALKTWKEGFEQALKGE